MSSGRIHRWPETAGRYGSTPARAAERFWADFSARAARTPQIEPVAARPVPRFAAVAAVAAVAALIVGLAVWRAAAPAVSPAILSLSTGTAGRPVFILRDDRTAAVILWVDAAEPPAGGAGG